MAHAESQMLCSILGVFIHTWRSEIADGYDMSCLLIWHEIFHVTVPPHGHELGHIWKTFHDHHVFLSHGAGRLIPDQAKVPIALSLQVLISGLGPLISKDSLDPLSSNLIGSRRYFPCCLFS